MGASIRLGRILGIPIGVNYSWIVIFLLFTYLIFNWFDQPIYHSWPFPQRLIVALITSALFFLSVLAHELSHSLVAISKGIPVRGITLFIFGGVSQLAHEARRPLTEFLVAVVGPLTSVVIGMVCLGLSFLSQGEVTVSPRETNSLAAVFLFLSMINFSLGVFNLAPGFPLDGGRVLRSVVWGVTGSYWRATQIATGAGQLMGGAMVGGGLVWAFWGFSYPEFQGLWMALIGGFLFSAATANYRHERTRESLKAHRVTEVMATSWYTLPGDTPLEFPLVARALAGGQDFLGVSIGGPVRGIVTRSILARVPIGAWSRTTLAQVMVPLSSIPQVTPEEGVFDALEMMEADNLDRVVVTRNGVLLGFVSRLDSMRLLQLGGPSGI